MQACKHSQRIDNTFTSANAFITHTQHIRNAFTMHRKRIHHAFATYSQLLLIGKRLEESLTYARYDDILIVMEDCWSHCPGGWLHFHSRIHFSPFLLPLRKTVNRNKSARILRYSDTILRYTKIGESRPLTF